MNPLPDLDEQLAAALARAVPALRPRPVDSVLRRGRQRHRRHRAATVGAVAALVLSGVGGGLLMRPAPPPEVPHPPATAAPAPRAPRLTELFSGRTAVTLTLDAPTATEGTGGRAPAQVVMGHDDDDRILVDGTEGRDDDLRNRWLVQPRGGGFVLRLAVKQSGGWVCISRESGGELRIRLCHAGAAVQQFTVTTTDERTYILAWQGTPVRVSRDGALVVGGDGTAARFTMDRA